MRMVLFLGLLCIMAFAGERAGPYAGIGYGAALYGDGGRFETQDDNPSGAYRLCAGAYISDFLSVEADYTLFEAYESFYGESNATREHFSALSVSVLFHTEIGKVDWYAKAGAGEVNWEEKRSDGAKRSDSGGSLVFGAGAGYRVAERVTLRLEYDHYDFALKESNHKYRMNFELLMGLVEVRF